MSEKRPETIEEFYKKWNENYETPYIRSQVFEQAQKAEFILDMKRVICSHK